MVRSEWKPTWVGNHLALELGNDLTLELGNHLAPELGNDLALELGNDLTLELGNHLTLELGNDLALQSSIVGNIRGPRHQEANRLVFPVQEYVRTVLLSLNAVWERNAVKRCDVFVRCHV
jgi:hypothetical protein